MGAAVVGRRTPVSEMGTPASALNSWDLPLPVAPARATTVCRPESLRRAAASSRTRPASARVRLSRRVRESPTSSRRASRRERSGPSYASGAGVWPPGPRCAGSAAEARSAARAAALASVTRRAMRPSSQAPEESDLASVPAPVPLAVPEPVAVAVLGGVASDTGRAFGEWGCGRGTEMPEVPPSSALCPRAGRSRSPLPSRSKSRSRSASRPAFSSFARGGRTPPASGPLPSPPSEPPSLPLPVSSPSPLPLLSSSPERPVAAAGRGASAGRSVPGPSSPCFPFRRLRRASGRPPARSTPSMGPGPGRPPCSLDPVSPLSLPWSMRLMCSV